jgi:hypothetical protein
MAKPFVSVLIDTYNHERFIEQAIASVLEQDFPATDREIIVMDDGSTDRTPEIVKKFEPRVRLLRKENGGQASALNIGIPECKGEIVAFLDGDDWWAPGKLRRVAEFLAAEPAVGFVGHGILESFDDGAVRGVTPERQERLRLNSLAAARVFRLRKSYLGTSRMTMRAALARQLLPVPEALVIEADEYLFTLAAALGDLVILPDTLTHYRLHGANLYNAAGGNAAGLRRKQQVISALAEILRLELSARGVPADAVFCVTEIVQAEADQLRLMLDGGTPWETLRTENTIYAVMHGDASRSQRLFRWATMLPACILPPLWFYAARRWLAGQSWYRTTRERALPVPRITRVEEPEEFKA